MQKDIIRLIRENGIPAEKLCFEITETAAISNFESAIEFIRELRQIGCHVALDDFGSGMSSFAYLKNLPVSHLKIDGAFVRNIHRDPIDRAMVEAITGVSHKIGLKVIAEYVSNSETYDILGEIGVDYAQGYAIDQPQPLGMILH
ncbi:MAG: EAL domain-containing protein, partial [Gammaproteobacteria bacterium]|nr:EAL domain-containing protein [Gammaproteobacteria bacterium]